MGELQPPGRSSARLMRGSPNVPLRALLLAASAFGVLAGAGLAAAAPPSASGTTAVNGERSVALESGVGAPIIGTSGPDDLKGTKAAEMIDGLGGDDTVDARGGDDVLRGGRGGDLLLGRAGDDEIKGGAGGDRMHGGRGTDTLMGGKNADRLYGGNGGDTLRGGPANDLLVGDSRNTAGNDTLRGDAGDDVIHGRAGADELHGGPGRDRLGGGLGPDRLQGGPDKDLIFASAGADTIIHVYSDNRDNADTYSGGRGNDTLRVVISSADLRALGTTSQALRDHFDATAPGAVRFGALGIDLGLTITGIENLEIGPSVRGIKAPAAAITVDGDARDWVGIAGIDVTLESLQSRDDESKEASVKVAHDGQFVYVLLEVADDYDWDPDDAHRSGAAAVMWNADPDAGPHMGADDPSGTPGIGMVDIWHWELECASGVEHGGAVNGPGDGDPGNDAVCNLDDEWSNNPFARQDDNGAGAENSLLGVWTHTNPTEDAAGTWIFEVRRPLQTGDERDGQLAPGETAQLAIAYWDPDQGPTGWDDSGHVQSSNQGWIDVTLGS